MKLTKDNNIGTDSNTVFEGYDAKIDEKQMHKLWDLLQDPYKNSIGAVVREYVSNSFDSHAEAAFIKDSTLAEIRTEYPTYNDISDTDLTELQKHMQRFDNDAVTVSIAKDDSGWYWATEDYGVGLSPQRVKDVFCNYLSSTKESTNNVIGAFGIGSKSGLSYNDVIFIRTRFNGEESQYMLRKGEKSPRLDIVSTVPTTEKNGSQIKVYIKEGASKYSYRSEKAVETWRFQEECRKQLAYFDNVYFNDEVNIANNYTIAQGQHWIKSSQGSPFSGLHLCLGKVAYPIDWDALGMDKLDLDVALKFEIGELDVIQTREDIKYSSPRTKQAIFDKIELLKTELKTKWESENNLNTSDLLEYIRERKMSPILTFEVNSWSFDLWLNKLFTDKDLPGWKFVPFENIGYNAKKVPDWAFFKNFHIPSYVNDSGLKHRAMTVESMLNGDSSIYRIEGNHETKKSKYIYHEVVGGQYYFLRKNPNKMKLRDYLEYFDLEDYPRNEWRTIIVAIQDAAKKAVFDNTESYAKVKVDKEWLKEQRNNSTRVYDNTVFNTYQFTTAYSYAGSWKSVKLKKGQVDRDKKTLYIAGHKEHTELLLSIADVYENLHPKLHKSSSSGGFMKVLYVAPTNAKYLNDAKNLITVENYKDQRIFKRICTVKYLKNNEKYKRFFEMYRYQANVAECLSSISSKVDKEFRELTKFVQSNDYNSMNNAFFDDVYDYVMENGLLDIGMIAKADFIVDYFEDLPLISLVEWHRIKGEELAYAIYRFNKSVPKEKIRKLNPNFYVNLNEQEQGWLNESERELYNKCRMI